MKKLLYPAYFYPCEEKRGAYTVIVPDRPDASAKETAWKTPWPWPPTLQRAG